MDEKRWENWKGRLPKSHEWECSYAVKDKNRGRAKGGFIIGKKIEWNVKRCKLIGKEEDGMVMTNIKMEKERINIVSVYDVHGSKKRRKRFDKFMGEKEVRNIMIGGNFNVGISELGGGSREEGEVERHSKDRVVGNEGKKFHRMDKRERVVYSKWKNRRRLGGRIYICRSQR